MSVAAPSRSLDEYLNAELARNKSESLDVHNAYEQLFAEITTTLRSSAAQRLSRAQQILSQVRGQHTAGDVIVAADILLHYIVELLDEDSVLALNDLINALVTSMAEPGDAELYDDRGLARIHNVLALTVNAKDYLPARHTLRLAYRDHVAAREGEAAAHNAIELL